MFSSEMKLSCYISDNLCLHPCWVLLARVRSVHLALFLPSRLGSIVVLSTLSSLCSVEVAVRKKRRSSYRKFSAVHLVSTRHLYEEGGSLNVLEKATSHSGFWLPKNMRVTSSSEGAAVPKNSSLQCDKEECRHVLLIVTSRFGYQFARSTHMQCRIFSRSSVFRYNIIYLVGEEMGAVLDLGFVPLMPAIIRKEDVENQNMSLCQDSWCVVWIRSV